MLAQVAMAVPVALQVLAASEALRGRMVQMASLAQAAQAAMGVLGVTVPLLTLVLVHLTRTRLAVPAAMAVTAVLVAAPPAPMAMAAAAAMAVSHLHQLKDMAPRTRLAVLAVPAEGLRGQAMAVPRVMAAMRPLMDIERTRLAALGVLAE